MEQAREYGKEVGANVLLFNYSGTGESEGEIMEEKDLVANGCRVIDHLISHGVLKQNIILYGQSIGGGTATIAGSLYSDIHLINQRSFARLDHAASEIVKKFKIPVLGETIGSITKKIFQSNWKMNAAEALEKFEIGNVLVIHHPKDGLLPESASFFKAVSDKKSAASKVSSLEHKVIELKAEFLKKGSANRILNNFSEIQKKINSLGFQEKIDSYEEDSNTSSSLPKKLQDLNKQMKAENLKAYHDRRNLRDLHQKYSKLSEAINSYTGKEMLSSLGDYQPRITGSEGIKLSELLLQINQLLREIEADLNKDNNISKGLIYHNYSIIDSPEDFKSLIDMSRKMLNPK